ncbi:MAG: polymer-forming cytoskeletal protein [Bacteroidetes bacterium]|nr:polymer-forming cytoskeletal protein [Bacteroidota bacterium]
MVKPNEPESNAVNLIGQGTTIQGDITSNGDVRIDGTLKGTLTSKGKVVVGTTGVVEGQVNCQNADVSGSVQAKVMISELLTLKPSARLNGDIITNKLAIEPGAVFSGSCKMGEAVNERTSSWSSGKPNTFAGDGKTEKEFQHRAAEKVA